MRRLFVIALFHQFKVVWPILSGILLIMIGCGFLIGRIEDWPAYDGLYFTFVTGLTIGYGDLVPQHAISRLLAVAVGFASIVLTGLVAAMSVQALRAAEPNREE
jgi:Ion channel